VRDRPNLGLEIPQLRDERIDSCWLNRNVEKDRFDVTSSIGSALESRLHHAVALPISAVELHRRGTDIVLFEFA